MLLPIVLMLRTPQAVALGLVLSLLQGGCADDGGSHTDAHPAAPAAVAAAPLPVTPSCHQPCGEVCCRGLELVALPGIAEEHLPGLDNGRLLGSQALGSFSHSLLNKVIRLTMHATLGDVRKGPTILLIDTHTSEPPSSFKLAASLTSACTAAEPFSASCCFSSLPLLILRYSHHRKACVTQPARASPTPSDAVRRIHLNAKLTDKSGDVTLHRC